VLQTGLKTNKEGKLMVENLKPGVYQFVEVKAPFGYTLDETPIPFMIDKGQVSTVIKVAMNELTPGSVELIKVDKDNNQIVLEGAEFELRDAEGNILQSGLTTNEEGKLVVKNLKPGTYQFVETKAPVDYKLTTIPFVFSISKGQAVTVQVLAENELIPGSVELIKVDEANHKITLSGAEFMLKDEKGKVIFEGLVTDQAGRFIVNDLKPGKYQFIETRAPKGYEKRAEPVVFTIEKGQLEPVSVTVTNKAIPVKVEKPDVISSQSGGKGGYQLPSTATSYYNYLLVGLSMLLLGALLLGLNRRKFHRG
jgi:LPXTG-motif cell wall-anchored protein